MVEPTKLLRLSTTDDATSGQDAFSLAAIRAELDWVSKTTTDDRIKEAAQALLNSLKAATIAPDQLLQAEHFLIAVYPEARLQRVAWVLRERLRFAGGHAVYKTYLASVPPSPSSASESKLRADLLQILIEAHRHEMLARTLERARHRMAARVGLTSMGLFLGTLLYMAIVVTSNRLYVAPLLLVWLAGMVGGSLSALQRLLGLRLRSSSIESVLVLDTSKMTWILPPIKGAVFATVAFVAFAAGLLKGPAFPEIVSPTRAQAVMFLRETKEVRETGEARQTGEGVIAPLPVSQPGESLSDLSSLGLLAERSGRLTFIYLTHTAPRDGLDYSKLLVWAFIAGFAQRFMPDALSRLAAADRSRNRGGLTPNASAD